MKTFFDNADVVRYEGPNSTNPLSYKYYDANKVVLGKTMAEHLRISVSMWHSFCWQGRDGFGLDLFNRPWMKGSRLERATDKVDATFEFLRKLNVPFISFHDEDILAFEHDSFKSYTEELNQLVGHVANRLQETNTGVLLSTSNLTTHPCFASGAATSSDPQVFAFAAAKVKNMMDNTKVLNGQNYVLWGGRDGYNSLLNTDLKRELNQLGKFVSMVVDYKHKIGYQGAILIEPKPCEPTKHQYDFDVATVYGFLKKFGLEDEVKLNIEANHATLAGHTFEHEIAYAGALNLLGSIDVNRGDPQNGWDTDQFPIDLNELVYVQYQVLKNGGLNNGGYNFDARIRRDSTDLNDLLYAHIGGIDALARSLDIAASLYESRFFENITAERYAPWNSELGESILAGKLDLQAIFNSEIGKAAAPSHRSSRQELIENKYNQNIWNTP